MRFALFLLLFLAACASPAPEFFRAEQVEVTRDGRRYTVFYTDTAVEVVRHGYAGGRAEHDRIRATMIDMVPVVTGCTLISTSVKGDSGEMRGRIRCPKPP